MAQDGAPLIVVAAGGTGGHLFPAEALALALQARGAVVDLATDERATRYGKAFPARETHIIPSETLRGRDPISIARMLWRLSMGFAKAYGLHGRLRPVAVVGFGGYPTLPPLLAACFRRIPTVIHEQNGVMGRANRILAPRVTAIATTFPGALDAYPALAAKATATGNPLRPAVLEAAKEPYSPPDGGRLKLLVFGGSQGARVMADVVPPAIEALDARVRPRLSIVHQARDEDMARVKEIYGRLGLAAEIEPFFTDLPARIAAAHLIVSRAGATTVSELAAIGRPAILVPLPNALDQDQMANANVLGRAGGALVLPQSEFSPRRLAAELTALAAAADKLAAMAAAARSLGVLDGAERLADLVFRVAGVVPGTKRETRSTL